MVSQRESCVTLRKMFRKHVNAATEASSCAKLSASEISWFNHSAIASCLTIRNFQENY